jgi:hypothetical protein
MLLVGLAVVLLVALVAGVVAVVRDPSSGRVPAGPLPVGTPRRILAVTDHNQPVVLDARTGRTLVTYESHSVAAGTQLAVAPDGRSFYFVDGDGNEGCQHHTILRFGLAPGVPGAEVADEASEPAISPDGRWLAFYRCTGGNAPGASQPDQLVVRDLRLGAERTRSATRPDYFGERLFFEKDSRHLIIDMNRDQVGSAGRHHRSNGLYRFDIEGGALPGVSFGVAPWAVFGPRGSTGEYLGMFRHVRGPYPLVVMRPEDVNNPAVFSAGKITTLPAEITGSTSDASGRQLLTVAGGRLYRWHRGQGRPTELRGGVMAAAWIPPTRYPVPSVAVAQTGGQLQVWLTPTSEVMRDVTVLPDVSPQIVAVPEGDGIVAGVNFAGPCDQPNDPAVERVDLADGSTERVASGRYPVVSVTGLVAYEIRCDGVTLGTTDLASGASTRSNPIGDSASEASPRVQRVLPVAFSPDGTQLLYWVAVRGAGERWYVARVSAQGFLEHRPRRLPSAVGTKWAFLDDRHLAAAFYRHPYTTVRSVTLPRRRGGRVQVGAPIQKFNGAVIRMSVDPTGRWFLAVLRGGVLVSWSRGGTHVGQIVGNVESATWLPSQVGG